MGDSGTSRAVNGRPALRGGSLDALRARIQRTDTAGVLRPVARSPGGEPCSCEQTRAWFLEQWEGSSALYHVVSRWRIDGTLDESALQRALDALVARHESLRTGFPASDGQPVQRIAGSARCILEHLDADLADAHARVPFDLEQPPLLRAAIWQDREGVAVLQLVTHHIVSDGWSQGVLQRELGALYAAALTGVDAALPALPVQYADFAHWQRERLTAESFAGLLDYWRGALANAAPLALPTDFTRPVQPDYRGATVDLRIDPALTARLRALAQEHGCTLYMVLLAAFKLLLARWSGQQDIVVGTPVAGRGQPELDHLIGFFANTLVLRTQLDLAAGVAALLESVRTTALGAFDHAAMPFEKLVEELKPPRDPGRNPLFQVMFALRNAPAAHLELIGCSTQRLALRTDIAKFDLTLEVSERDDGLDVQLEYACALFGHDTVTRMADHYIRLLESLPDAGEQAVGRLPMLGANERHLILHDWNDTAVAWPPDATLASMIAAGCARSPHAPALVCGDRMLDHAGLHARADRLARRLLTLGIGPERCVAVCMSRSVELVVALLAIVKAGGVYVPMDPDYPDARLDYMLDDTGASVVLTEGTQAHRFAACTATLICLDRDACGDDTADENPPADAPVAPSGPRNAAYIIYTSGSTGQPKGVVIEHAAICNHMHWMLDRFGFDASDRILHKTGLSADASVWELLAPLCCGACMVLAPPGSQREPARLVREMQAQRVTVMQVVPSLLRALVAEPGFSGCSALKQMFCGGEALDADVVAAFFARSSARLHNLYGPTEAAIDATWWTCDASASDPVPIGRPIDNMQAYVLDAFSQPVPAGVAGELHLGGIGLARAYLGRPDLSAERFIPHPFDAHPDARLYRTGDRVMWRKDGTLTFIGRVDHQIKLRGFRIEPGEIESALAGHPAVAQSVVIAREDRPGDRRLVAYVTGRDGPPAVPALREHLRQALPAHLMPSAIIVLERLPLTPHGKIDRGALPPPDVPEPTPAVPHPATGSPHEQALTSLWADVLGLPRVGPHDSFFDLGGHSLLAARLCARLRARFGIDVPLAALLDAPTAHTMSDWLESHRAVVGDTPADGSLTWWLQRLEGCAALALPGERARTDSPVHLRADVLISATLLRQIDARAHAAACSRQDILLAAFQLLLARWSGQHDIATGLAAGAGTDAAVIVRTTVDLASPARKLIETVCAGTRDALAHAGPSLAALIGAAPADGPTGAHPLFQSWFSLRDDITDRDLIDPPGPGIELALDLAGAAQDPYALTARMHHCGGRPDSETLHRMAAHYLILLGALAEDDGTVAGRLPMLTPSEAEQLAIWNDTAHAWPEPATLHGLFEAQVARTPSAVALVDDRGTLQYDALNAQADRIARALLQRGAGPQARVGVHLGLSRDLVVSLIGVLKAGAVYVPLDTGNPEARTHFMLTDAGATHLITRRDIGLSVPDGLDVLYVDDESGGTATPSGTVRPAVTLPPTTGDDTLAYVLYTSGSTGTPKGVMIGHAAICNRMRWLQSHFGIGPDDAMLATASIGFDVSVGQLFAALICGGRCVLAADALRSDTAALVELTQRENVTLWDFTPALLRLLIEEPALPACRSLRHVFCGGEAMDATLPQAFRRSSKAALHNLYGPTETAIDATCWTCSEELAGLPPPIGHPIANTRTHVLDAFMQAVPVGVEGELYIGGAGLAQGYAGRPDLTAERFLPLPSAPAADIRVYRTGDRVRRRSDGALMFVGRSDHQIKLNGVRIETGEIEAALSALPGVLQAAVELRSDHGPTRLEAWVTGKALDPAALRTGLARTLPAHMVPGTLTVLERLPLTTHGKVDRRALPRPGPHPAAPARQDAAPRTPLQQTLAELWSEVLGLHAVGIDDDFFALGGHSLLAARLVSRLRAVLDRDLPLRALFEAPSVAAMAARLEDVRPTEVDRTHVTPPAAGTTDTRDECAHAQAGLWFIERMGSGDGLYHIVSRWRVDGPLDRASLQQALDLLIARQSALRTAFVEREGRPCLQVADAARCAIETITAEEADEHASRAFDLACAPLLRVALWREPGGAQALQVVVHHIVSDGWSQAVFNQELGALYAAVRQHRPAPLPPLPVQYADFARAQRALFRGPDGDRLQDYWRTRLNGLPTLELPTDRPRPVRPDHRGGTVDFTLDAPLVSDLRDLARQHGCTLYMVLLAAFQLLLARWSGQDDIAVGTPVAGRGQPELDNVIGLFAHTLVLRSAIDREGDTAALLRQVRGTALGAFEHADMPFDRLVDVLRPEREAGRHPLFQVMFVLQNAPAATLGLEGTGLTAIPAARPVAKFDLTLELTESGDGLAAQCVHACALFDTATIVRMTGHYRRLLESMVASPAQAVGRLPLLTPDEWQTLLVDWNDTAADYPEDATLASLFESRVAQAPDAPALVDADTTLSYSELNTRANRLAHRLRALGVGPDRCAGLCMRRSVDLVVGALAILKAGGAYVPMDPSWPAARIARLLDDTGAVCALADHAIREGVVRSDGGAIQVLHADDAGLAGQPADNPPALGNGRSLAYVIYTSGSTGQPKGVMVEQHSVARLVFGTAYARFSAEETFLLLAPMAFDASTFELWGALLHGARCVIHPEAAATAAGLEAVIARHGVSTLWLTAALFNAVIDERPEALRGLRQLLTGGEALSVPHVRRALSALPGLTLINGYGPTESTTFTCCQRIPPSLPEDWTTIPIGRPIGNTTVYVLDSLGQPVPASVEGELYIGGDGLARGYLGAPELTAARFVAPPFDGCPDARLYRTGDRVRWRADGSIAFVGRADQQIKLRGFRIEPGEIEAALAALPGVRQAAVMLHTDARGERRLLAWAAGDALDGAALRAGLARTLPDYMLPAAVITLDHFPVTANGKLDRKALPAPDATEPARTTRAPVDATERHLLAIWEALFGRGGLSTDDDFFALGGHSLLAVRVVDAVERTFGIRLPLDTFWFRGNTVRDIATLLRGESGRTRWPLAVPIKQGGQRPPLFCVHTIGGNLFHYYDLARALPDDLPVVGLNAVGVGGLDRARWRIEDIAADCIAALRIHQPEGPYHLAGFSSGGTVAFEMAQQLRAAGQEVAYLGLLDTWAPGLHVRPPSPALLPRMMAALRPHFRRDRLVHALLHRFGLTPPGGFPDVASAHWWAHWSYRPRRYDGHVDLYVADTSRHEAADPSLGWSDRVTGTLTLHSVAGSHGRMVKAPHVHTLAAMIRQRIAGEDMDGC